MRKLVIAVAVACIAAQASAGCTWESVPDLGDPTTYHWELVCTPDYNTVLYVEPTWGMYQYGDVVWRHTYLDSNYNPVTDAWYVYRNDDPNRGNSPDPTFKGPLSVHGGDIVTISCYPFYYIAQHVAFSDGSYIDRTIQFCDSTLERLACSAALYCDNPEYCEAAGAIHNYDCD